MPIPSNTRDEDVASLTLSEPSQWSYEDAEAMCSRLLLSKCIILRHVILVETFRGAIKNWEECTEALYSSQRLYLMYDAKDADGRQQCEP